LYERLVPLADASENDFKVPFGFFYQKICIVKPQTIIFIWVLLKTGFSILDISGAIFFDHSGCIQV
jgi:hypothetical protein